MRKTKFLGKVLSLALAVTLIVGMVPEMRAKAAESNWIQVTSENIDSLDQNLSDLSELGDKLDDFLYILRVARGDDTLLNNPTGYYILGKMENGSYKCWNRRYSDGMEEISRNDIEAGTHSYYYWPQYTITLDSDGGTLENGITTVTTRAGLLYDPPVPVKEGKLFTGWFESAQSLKGISNYTVFHASTEICAHWVEDTKREWVRVTSVKDLPDDELPIISGGWEHQFINNYCESVPLPEDAYQGVFGRFYSGDYIWYLNCSKLSTGEMAVSNYIDLDVMDEWMGKEIFYVLKETGEPRETPEPVNPTPTTPAPAPVTPTPAPTPVTPTTAPSAGDTSSDSSDSGSSAPEPVLTTTNIAGEQITGWDAITKVISTQTKDKQQNVSGANQDLLHVDAGGFDKAIPAATVKAVSTSALRGLHVFIGNSDAVTFLAKSKLSGYKETNFEHKDTVTEHSRTIDFTNKQALGTNVVFHTTVPVKNGEVTVYKVDANGRTRIVKTVSNAGGQVCFPITETATYVLEY